MKNKDWAWLVVVILGVMLSCIEVGMIVSQANKRAAIRAGVARWVATGTGAPEFQWIVPKKVAENKHP